VIPFRFLILPLYFTGIHFRKVPTRNLEEYIYKWNFLTIYVFCYIYIIAIFVFDHYNMALSLTILIDGGQDGRAI